MEVIAYLEEFSLASVVIRLCLAALLGSLIGMERAAKRRPAGVRTFALVCLGASLAMVTNQFLIDQYGSGDPARLAAQVISGIGFLGIGTIVVTGQNYVRGLTTAATLWVTATLGIAIGSGFIFGSLLTFLLIMVIVHFLSIITKRQEQFNRMIDLYIEIEKDCGTRQIVDYFHEKKYSIVNIEKNKKMSIDSRDIILFVDVDMKHKIDHRLVLAEIHKLESVRYVEELK